MDPDIHCRDPVPLHEQNSTVPTHGIMEPGIPLAVAFIGSLGCTTNGDLFWQPLPRFETFKDFQVVVRRMNQQYIRWFRTGCSIVSLKESPSLHRRLLHEENQNIQLPNTHAVIRGWFSWMFQCHHGPCQPWKRRQIESPQKSSKLPMRTCASSLSFNWANPQGVSHTLTGLGPCWFL